MMQGASHGPLTSSSLSALYPQELPPSRPMQHAAASASTRQPRASWRFWALKRCKIIFKYLINCNWCLQPRSKLCVTTVMFNIPSPWTQCIGSLLFFNQSMAFRSYWSLCCVNEYFCQIFIKCSVEIFPSQDIAFWAKFFGYIVQNL